MSQNKSKQSSQRSKRNGDDELLIHETLQEKAYLETIQTVLTQLPTRRRILSRVIHFKYIEGLNEFLELTIFRPVSFFIASIVCLLGTGVTAYLAKQDGYTYNYLLFAYFLVSGYALGLLIELGIYLSRKLKS